MNAYVRACKYIIILPQFPRLRTEKALKRGRYAAPGSEGSKGSEGSEGKVDGASPRGLWPPDGGGLCRKVVKGKVLKMDRPDGRKVLKFDGLSGRGLWWRLRRSLKKKGTAFPRAKPGC